MPQPDDLFQNSKMSFGDHLEELRAALFKSLAAIAIGFLIGLYFAGDFIQFISEPLKVAVDTHLLNDAQKDYIADMTARKEAGQPVPDDIEAAAKLYFDKKLAPKKVLIAHDQIGGPARDANEDGLMAITIYEPVADDPRRMIGTNVTQGFMVYIKAALVLGLIIASPWVFFFIWNFVAAGLYPHEKNYVFVFLPFSLGLFLAGASLAFFVAVGFVLNFLFKFYALLDIAPYPIINDWLSFILILPIGFGIGFQLPLVMLFLERIGVFTRQNYLKQWRIAVVVICILSTILTPADPGSMILMAVPLIILYFFGILLCRYMPKRKTPFGEMIET